MKLGHRRKLQREVATCLGHPLREPLDLFSLSLLRGQCIRENGAAPWVVTERENSGSASQYAHEQSSSGAGLMAYAYFLCQDSKISDMLYTKFPQTVRKKWSRLSVDGKNIWNTQVVRQLHHLDDCQGGHICCENWRALTDHVREKCQVSCSSLKYSGSRPSCST